ncbi:MAG: redoxin domain-containing protein [Deltaproteobacteria bacterium]|nr:redoxin domain-containing protein [Deltaproteobacteria bacterium]
MRALVLSALAAALLVAPASYAGRLDPSALPTIGGTAPAFGLEAFRARGEEETSKRVVQLDDFCGMRPGSTSTLLVAFVNNSTAEADFAALNQWARKYSRDGFVSIAISTESNQTAMSELAMKGRKSFPILDDSYGIVAQRYGINGAPFSLLLDNGCKVLGMSDQAVSVDADRLSSSIDERAKNERVLRKK